MKATALGRGSVASLTLDCLYPLGKPRYSFYRKLSGLQDQSGYDGLKKISPPPQPPGAVQAVAKRLAA